ncbi:hypothetical protein VPNG_01101 [Cytospora leucostoma]|uniref:SGNH hydrolase-type esterase domain-containing protein n=1 Tax=Cytospora leucostoma TaxID=1230097 RepID=A0A423XL20_9PEZI|nr:hypothetical protein VPNG_01101 [Cytospora leucostoma]
MKASLVSAVPALLASAVEAHVLPTVQHGNNNSTPKESHILARVDSDPTDFSWVKRFAAVGDSFTAGIGSGAPLASFLTQAVGNNDWYCARYDTSYPEIMYKELGKTVEDFQYVACSGDRTGDIYTQIQGLEGDLDLVVMTAGGNDLCLASMIKSCVFLPFSGEDACTSVIDIAQNNLDSILKDNLMQLMEALDDKMKDDGIVIFNGYAQFFNTENEDCATEQDWTLLALGSDPLTLTIERRKTFNNLVVQINDLIQGVVNDTAANSKYNWHIGFSNWGLWPSDGVTGQMCDPASTGVYPDTAQPNLQFFKPDTSIKSDAELKKRDVGGPAAKREAFDEVMRQNAETELYNSRLYNSANPQAEALHMLDSRAPTAPGCPGDSANDTTSLSLGLPNFIGKLFHPNELGHYTIASWALQTIIDIRAEVLDVTAPTCATNLDQFTCYQKTGSTAYTNEDQLNEKYESFCKGVTKPAGIAGWKAGYRKTYLSGTPDEFVLSVYGSAYSSGENEYDEDECINSMSRIINSCDGNDPDNPMDWKFGGEYTRGNWVYRVSPQRDTRPWPVMKAASGSCKGWYKGFFSSYTITGSGFSDYDWGQKTLLKEAKSCVGGGITHWKFTYSENAVDDGYEWKATFRTPIGVRRRCFKNNKVVTEINGFTDGCGGND